MFVVLFGVIDGVYLVRGGCGGDVDCDCVADADVDDGVVVGSDLVGCGCVVVCIVVVDCRSAVVGVGTDDVVFAVGVVADLACG